MSASAANLLRWTAACTPALAAATFTLSPWPGLSAMFLSHAALLYGMMRPNCQWLGPVATSFHTQDRTVWLTIDDGPDPHDTLPILEELDRAGARATFFVIGAKARAHPDLLRAIVQAGHTLSNHTATHPSGSFWAATPGVVAREIDACTDALKNADVPMQPYFRAPAGLKSPFLHRQLRIRNLCLAGWTCRGYDTVARSAETAARKILNGARPGAILLLHQGTATHDPQRASLTCIRKVLSSLEDLKLKTEIPSREQLRFDERQTGVC
jgi:peptidoglycan/xylan/chitin deacetylase (PgdA/CDA1 family)